MSSTIQTTADRFEEIVKELEGTFENMAFALATFDDYNHGSMGSGQDKPFILLQQVTDSTSDMQASLNSIPGHSGGDGQESDHEALYQAITMAPEDRERIFEPYVRADDGSSGGLGLGLAICRRIVAAHGGSISVGDEPGRGSRFSFTLAPAGEDERGPAS